MMLALTVFLWADVIVVFISIVSIVAVALAGVTLHKTHSIMGKSGILFSIIVLLACSSYAIIFLLKSQQAELQEALFRAAIAGNKDRIKDLVAKGANINKTRDYDGDTLLHAAIDTGDNRMFETLLAGGINVNAKSWNGITPMQLLLSRSVNPWQKKDNFHYEAAARALIAHGATFDFQLKDGRNLTCIQNAISNNQTEILKLMLENGADIKFKDEKGGYLHHAISEKAKIDIIDILLSAGADPNIADKNGDTAIHAAAYFGRRDIVEALLNKGANINALNNKGMTALSVAKNRRGNFLGNRQEVIELLQQKEENSQQK
jgi:hypothetical protein